MKKSTVLQLTGGTIIAGAGLYIFFRDVDAGMLLKEIKHTRLWIILAVFVLSPVSLFFRSLRWNLMLPSRPEVSRKGLFPLVMIGFMFNNIFPARIGEAVRAVLLWKRNRFTVMESVGSLLVERFIDTLVFSSFFFVPVFITGKMAVLYPWALTLAAGFSFALICFVLYLLFPGIFKVCTEKIIGIFPQKFAVRLNKVSAELFSSLDWMFSFRKVCGVLFYTILTAFSSVGMMFLLARGVSAFGFLESMFGVACAAFGAAIPLSPGYVGTLHTAVSGGLKIMGVGIEKAGAIAVLYHALGYISITSIGLYYFFSTRISLREINDAKQNMDAQKTENYGIQG
ncbi:MAG: flippase-like domain-containing protein [Fibrobacter sp.]|nr:flippase-like domain-containing protein [Fibrobacter sp.]